MKKLSLPNNEDSELEKLRVPWSSMELLRRHSWDGNSAKVLPHATCETMHRNELSHEYRATTDFLPEAKSNSTPWWNLSSLRNVFHEKRNEDNGDKQQNCPNASEVTKASRPLGTSQTDQTTSPSTASTSGLRKRSVRFTDFTTAKPSTEKVEASSSKRKLGIGNWISEADPRVLWDIPSKLTNQLNNFEAGHSVAMPPILHTSPQHDPQVRSMHSRRATVHYSSSGRPSFMGSKRRSLRAAILAKEERALEQMKDICRDYVVYRLRKRNLVSKAKIVRQQQVNNRWLLEDMLFIVNELDRSNASLFKNISRQVGVTIRSEDVLRKVFSELAVEIITTEPKKEQDATSEEPTDHGTEKATKRTPCGLRYVEITWGRICAVLGITGGLAVDCVQQGHADLVNFLIEYCGEFAREEGLLSWIATQGGWEAFHSMAFDNSMENAATDYSYFTKLCSVTLAFIAFALATVLIVAVVSSVANTV